MTSQRPTHELFRAKSPPGPCGYLPGEISSLAYRVIVEIGADGYGELLRRGWRRQGCSFFRPACAACVKCRSLRVDVPKFRPTKSQRRVLRRNAGIRVEVHQPAVTPEHLAIYNAYHADMQQRRGWPEQPTTAEDYEQSLLFGEWEFASEFRYYDGDRLVGVGLVDAVADGLSSVYFYHDPAWRPLGPGTFSVLQEIQQAQATGRQWLYLGYWIAECGSMNYKARFAPHEVLEHYVDDDQEPRWLRVEG